MKNTSQLACEPLTKHLPSIWTKKMLEKISAIDLVIMIEKHGLHSEYTLFLKKTNQKNIKSSKVFFLTQHTIPTTNISYLDGVVSDFLYIILLTTKEYAIMTQVSKRLNTTLQNSHTARAVWQKEFSDHADFGVTINKNLYHKLCVLLHQPNPLSNILKLYSSNIFWEKVCDVMQIRYKDKTLSFNDINNCHIMYAHTSIPMDLYFNRLGYVYWTMYESGGYSSNMPVIQPPKSFFSHILPHICYDMFTDYVKKKNITKIKKLFKTTGISFECIPDEAFISKTFCKKLICCKSLVSAYFGAFDHALNNCAQRKCIDGCKKIAPTSAFISALDVWEDSILTREFLFAYDNDDEIMNTCELLHLAHVQKIITENRIHVCP